MGYDNYVSAKVSIPKDGYQFANGVVKRRARDENGVLIGKANPNPLLDTSVYEVELEDGSVERYHANILAEHIYSSIDKDGYTTSAFVSITDHKSNDAALRGQPGVKTTKGWSLCVKLCDGSSMWVPLSELKESNPIETAEYAKAMGIDDEPAFSWWVPHTLQRTRRILKAMKKRYFRTTQKYGIELPHTVKPALQIDRETGTTFWQDALKKEMNAVMVAFKILEAGANRPPGYEKVHCHIIFDIKMGTLQRKARYVCGGHTTNPPPEITTYASVVSRESVRIAFTLAALNGLDIQTADVSNAYLNAPSRERLITKCGPEFGPDLQGRWAIIQRALYGSKSAAASWRASIIGLLEQLGFKMCRADNDVMMRAGFNSKDLPVWEYVLVYSDDFLVIARDPKAIINEIDKRFKIKEGSTGEPSQYLGAAISRYQLKDGSECWAMSSDTYIKSAIDNIEAYLKAKGQKQLKTKTSCVLPSSWKPEIDTTDLLSDKDIGFYQSQIGILRWAVELARIDIATEVSMLATYSAAPRQGHLAAVLHVFAYLKAHSRSRLVLDPSYLPEVPAPEYDWTDFYGDVKEPIPPDCPEPRGKSAQTTAFIDSDHAAVLVSRHSRTGVLVYLQSAPVIWYTKKQGSIETSSFGSEFSAMKTGTEIIIGLRYKLRMMGVPLDGPTRIRADNMSVVNNCSRPESQLKKKSNSIAYHFCREVIASKAVHVSYEPTATNLADMLTKTQDATTRSRLASSVLR